MNELNADFTTGQTLYAVITNDANQYWYTVTPAFEAFNGAHWTTYTVAMVENDSTGRYVGDFPAGITAPGNYIIEVRQRIGGTAAVTDPVVSLGTLSWTGMAEGGPFATVDQSTVSPGGFISGTVSNFVPISGHLNTSDLDIGLILAGDRYRGTVPVDVPTGTYSVILVDADTQTLLAGTIVVAPVVAGTYFDETDLDDFYGHDNISAYSDLQNVGNGFRDTARIQKWISYTGDWLNLAWKRVGRPTPIPPTADDFTALTRIGAEWAGAMLAKGRGDIPEGWSSKDGFDSAMDGHIERAEKALADLVFLWSENESDTAGPSTAGAITAVVGAPKQYPGTGSVRPPAITVPSLTGDMSW